MAATTTLGARLSRVPLLVFSLLLVLPGAADRAAAQPFEERVVDIGNVGLTVTNAGYVGNNNIRNAPSGAPSFEYPLDSGIEHLFEAGLWVGAVRPDGTISVRTGSITSGGGYSPGAGGFEFVQAEPFQERSTLLGSPAFSPLAVSQQDFLTAYADTFAVIPGTSTPTPDPQGSLGIVVRQRSYAYSFPFAEAFVVMEFEVENVSGGPLDSVYVGIWEDLVVRNVFTTQEGGGDFFNKNGRGVLGYPTVGEDGAVSYTPDDSLFVSYAYNLGGDEESLNTYGSVSFLGATWDDAGAERFFHPFVADEYVADGLSVPLVHTRYWKFADANPTLARPGSDDDRYFRMATPLPLDQPIPGQEGQGSLADRLSSDGLVSQGNWIGLYSIGPFPRLEAGESLTATFAWVAALKPDRFQDLGGRRLDTDETRALLRTNAFFAQRTFAGEDANYNGRLDTGEDLNGNGTLDRYLIPEPPPGPNVRVEVESGRAILYWDDFAENAIDPVSGRADFEGYRVYRSDPGDDAAGNIIGEAGLIAQYDEAGNRVGFNNGFQDIRLQDPVTFPGDDNVYRYRFVAEGLLNGWQYAFSVTAFDQGDPDVGLEPLESSRTLGAVRVFPGTSAVEDPSAEGLPNNGEVGVYPNPFRLEAAWDGELATQRKLYFFNLPPRAVIRIYTMAGEIVTELNHDAATYRGDIRWYDTFSADNRVVASGEHAWDVLSENNLRLASGLYFFSVQDEDTGDVQTGKFVIIR
ncbi:MAG: hypothetical protein AAFN13_01275 [Bacteroidota bacterium]